MSDAIMGHGTVFERWDGTTFVAVAEVFDINGPGMSRDVIEVTNYDSPNKWREKIAGLRDAGEVSFTLNFLATSYTVFRDDFDSDDSVQYKITLPGGFNLTFNGFVTDLPLTVPVGDRVTMDVTIEISGAITDALV